MQPEITRAGIIPYTIARGEVWLLMTEDVRTGEKGDFGGGRKEKESVYEAACREAKEESSGILTLENSQEEFQPKLPVVHSNSLIYFLPVTFMYLRDSKKFFDLKGGNKEVKTLHIIKLSEVWNDRKNDLKIWPKIKTILIKNKNLLSKQNLSEVFHQ